MQRYSAAKRGRVNVRWLMKGGAQELVEVGAKELSSSCREQERDWS
jgi:hypothetical protein